MVLERIHVFLYQNGVRGLIWTLGKWQPPIFQVRSSPNVRPISTILQNLTVQHRPSVIAVKYQIPGGCRNANRGYRALVGAWTPHTLGVYRLPSQDQRGYAVKDSAPRSRGKIDPMARFGQLEPSNLKVGYDKLKELQDADEQVKKIFSLEYADDKEIQVYRKSKLVQEIQKDPTDYSLPVKIAVLTVHIRAVAKQLNISKKDLLAKEKLLGLIGRRRKFLKQLRQTDFERFERLLTELGITFTLPPPPQAVRFHTRRYLEKLVVRRKAREQRLKALGEFLTERKNRQMKEIIQLKKELGLELTEEEVSYVDSEAESD